jgi:hypothetical protein
MGEIIKSILEYFSSRIDRARENPELLAPYFLGAVGGAIGVIQYYLNQLNTISIFASFFLIAIALILYQFLNCNVRVVEILSDTEHYRKLKTLWITGKMKDDEFEKKMTLLKKYPNPKTPDLKSGKSE